MYIVKQNVFYLALISKSFAFASSFTICALSLSIWSLSIRVSFSLWSKSHAIFYVKYTRNRCTSVTWDFSSNTILQNPNEQMVKRQPSKTHNGNYTFSNVHQQQIEILHVHFGFSVLDCLFHFFERLFRLLTVLDQRQVLLLQLSKDVEKLVGIREVQLRLLRTTEKTAPTPARNTKEHWWTMLS